MMISGVWRFAIRRLVAMVLILLVLTAILFLLAAVAPGDPAMALLGGKGTASELAQARHQLWLDRPLYIQYVHYVSGLLRGNLGLSLSSHRLVASDLATYLPATIQLAFFGIILALFLGTLMAFASAGRWRGAQAFRVLLVAGASAPVFLLAIGGIIIFFQHLHWLPAIGETSYLNAPTHPTGFLLVDSLLAGRLDVLLDMLRHLILPSICVSLGPAVAIGRVLRSSLINSMTSDYIRTARSKGLSEWTVIWRHALRNAIGPALSMGGLQLGAVFAGVVVIESVFAWPGVGLYTVNAISSGDFPAVAGVTLVLGVAYVVVNAIVDILQGIADPRVRIE
jgi:peptide/nickel transport system permease protein